LGFPIEVDGAFGRETFTAVNDFQCGFAFWRLLVDGHAGPKTHEALRHAVEEEGRCSEHFKFVEFRSKGNGWIKVSRQLVLGLEEYRELVGAPVAIVSGYRDPDHNVRVGGAPNSQHLYGNAADLNPVKRTGEVARLRRFSGIGYQGATGLVRHVDVRHVGPNTTGGTVDDPTRWAYRS
jgi:zinc D-Ala-D-Ala carboxypeptidase